MQTRKTKEKRETKRNRDRGPGYLSLYGPPSGKPRRSTIGENEQGRKQNDAHREKGMNELAIQQNKAKSYRALVSLVVGRGRHFTGNEGF